jgi:hypothetical protein
VGRLLIWLSGAQPDILAQCKHDRAKYIGVGSAVLVTSSMAAVSMSFALRIALDAQLAVAIPFAVAWGLAIMSLDRWLVVSLVRQSPLRYFMLALPRLLLGLLFGIIISTPLTLQIFHVEIANQIALDHTKDLAAYNNSSAVQSLTARVSADTTVVGDDNAVIKSGGIKSSTPASQYPALAQAEDQLTKDQQQVTHYNQAAHCELYGGAGCSTIVSGTVELGSGPAYNFDEQELAMYNKRVQQDTTQVAAAQQHFNEQNTTNQQNAVKAARAKLAKDTANLNADTANLDSLKQSYVGSLGKDTGILASLQALDELRGTNNTLMLADLLLFLFFTAIEWLPILVKALLNLGPENTYEKLLAKREEESLRDADNAASRRYLAGVRDMDVATDGGQRFNDEWEREVLPGLMRDALDARERVARARLRRWERYEAANTSRTGYDDIFTPGGAVRGSHAPTAPEWLYGTRGRARRGRTWGARLAAAWHALADGETPRRGPSPAGPGLRATGPQPRYSDGY